MSSAKGPEGSGGSSHQRDPSTAEALRGVTESREGTWLKRHKALAAAAGTAIVMGAAWAGTAVGESDSSSKAVQRAGAPCAPGGHMGLAAVGEVASVSGNTIKLKGPQGAAGPTVQVNGSTKYFNSAEAAKSDLALGKNVAIMPSGPPIGSDSVTAAGVIIDPPDRGGKETGQGPRHRGLEGQIVSVGADTIKVKANGREVTVKLTGETKYRRFEQASLGDVKAGERIAAHSATERRLDTGTLVAQSIVVGLPEEPEAHMGPGPGSGGPGFHHRFGPGGPAGGTMPGA